MLSLLGQRAPLHATSAGKVWLASLPEQTALTLALKAGLQSFTAKTITDIDTLRAGLGNVREKGYAIVEEEFIHGGSGIGVPVRGDRNEDVIGVVVLSAPTFRLSREKPVQFVPQMKQVAERLRRVAGLAVFQAGTPMTAFAPEDGRRADASLKFGRGQNAASETDGSGPEPGS